MQFENNERNPWEETKNDIGFQAKSEASDEAEKFGWGISENFEHEENYLTSKKKVHSSMHFKSKNIPKSGNAASLMLAVEQEVVKRIKDHVVDTVKRKEQEANKKDENNGSPILLVLSGILFAFVILFMAPIVLLFTEQSEAEPKTVIAAKYELSVSQDNIGGQKYKDWFGKNTDWSAIFISYCANEGKYIKEGIMPKTESVAEMADWYKGKRQWKDTGNYEPKAGDIIFFQNGYLHVGVVINYNEQTKIVTTIEGNTGDVEAKKEYVHTWQLDICSVCDGDHKIEVKCTDDECSTCIGESLYYICDACGEITRLKGKFHKCSSTGNNIIGYSEKIHYSDYLECSSCYATGKYKGMYAKCTKADCSKNDYGSWEEFPDGICYIDECEYHEVSLVKLKKYSITDAEITGYGLPDYVKSWLENLYSKIKEYIMDR